jgi:hypothetical protein
MATKRAIVVHCNLCCKPSVAICVGCDRYYCRDHFDEHRQAFQKYIDDARKRRQSFSEYLVEFQQVENELRSAVEDWKHKAIEKVHRAASTASSELDTLIKNHRHRFEEESSMVINGTPINSDAQLIQIEKLLSEYGHTLKSIRLIRHNDRQPTLEIQPVNLKNEETSLQDSIPTGPYQADDFEPQSVLGKRLIKEPSTATPVGSYWTVGGSDTHLLVQEYETNQLTMFDRHGKRGISMTWHYNVVVSVVRVRKS